MWINTRKCQQMQLPGMEILFIFVTEVLLHKKEPNGKPKGSFSIFV